MRVEAFTDGAVSGNPGPGGWGVLLRFGDKSKTLAGGELETTNNRMELMGAIEALEALKRPCEVVLVTDSEYVKKGMTEWMAGWKKKDRMRHDSRKPIMNLDLWLRLEKAASRHQVDWQWVRGHSGHRENDIADDLAVSAKKLVISGGVPVRLVDGEPVTVEPVATSA